VREIDLKKVILFDLYDTVLKNISFDFQAGIVYLYNAFFSEVCSLEELIDYSETFLDLYEKRKVDYSEICLIKNEIPLFFDKFGVPLTETLDEIEYTVMNQMQKVTLVDEVRYTLNGLQELGIKMYILSNSIFTAKSANKLLNDFGIIDYFEKLFSSADYGIRKPSYRFYQIALDEILTNNPEVSIEDILYVGNDYVTDIIGATSVGLSTVWYNAKHLPNENNICTIDIDNFKKILEILDR
jgi:FMN phosphatase YigB (HAD superfamily)